MKNITMGEQHSTQHMLVGMFQANVRGAVTTIDPP
jgi:hypothetical protein